MNIYTNQSSWKISKYSTPFPFAEIDNFIKLDVYKEIEENFPSLKEFKKNGDITANNAGIRIFNKIINIILQMINKVHVPYIKNENGTSLILIARK